MIIRINYGNQGAIQPYTWKFKQDFIKAMDAGMDIEDFLNSHPDTPFILRGRHSLKGLQLMAIPFVVIVAAILGGIILAAWAVDILSKGKSQFGIGHINFFKDVPQFGAMCLPGAGILAVEWHNIASDVAAVSSILLALAWLFTKGETRNTMWKLYKYVTITGVAIVAITIVGTEVFGITASGLAIKPSGAIAGAIKKTGEFINTTGTNIGKPKSLFSVLPEGIGTNVGLSQYATDHSDSLANQYEQQPTQPSQPSQPSINWQNILIPASILGACGIAVYTVYQKTKKPKKRRKR